MFDGDLVNAFNQILFLTPSAEQHWNQIFLHCSSLKSFFPLAFIHYMNELSFILSFKCPSDATPKSPPIVAMSTSFRCQPDVRLILQSFTPTCTTITKDLTYMSIFIE